MNPKTSISQILARGNRRIIPIMSILGNRILTCVCIKSNFSATAFYKEMRTETPSLASN